MSESIEVFNRSLLSLRRGRAAKRLGECGFLFEETAERLLDRLDDVKRKFPRALDLGCHDGILARRLRGRGGIETLVQADLSPAMAARAGIGGLAVAADEEALPFGNGTLALVLSNLSLHWVNDLPGALVQIRRALKPDGLFLGTMLGGETLTELRQAFSEAETAEEGGVSPRVSPFADVRDAGDLLARAGFALPVADMETLTVSYADPLRLMADLRGMGESNAVTERRRRPTRRATLMAAAERYRALFGDEDGRIPATFQIITLTAWAPDPSQPQPRERGCGEVSPAEAKS